MSGGKLAFLADESCDFAVVRALRAAGYDVRAVGEEQRRSVDDEVIFEAAREGRLLLTEDKDFGWLAFVKGVEAGVILIRFPGRARAGLATTIVDLVAHHADALPHSFTVVEPGQIRISPRPR